MVKRDGTFLVRLGGIFLVRLVLAVAKSAFLNGKMSHAACRMRKVDIAVAKFCFEEVEIATVKYCLNESDTAVAKVCTIEVNRAVAKFCIIEFYTAWAE